MSCRSRSRSPRGVNAGSVPFSDSSGSSWLRALGATDQQLDVFAQRSFKGQPLLERWQTPAVRRNAPEFVEALTSRLPSAFNAVDAMLQAPALVETTLLRRTLHNLQQLQELRPSNHVELISADPVLLMHPESEFGIEERWTDFTGTSR